MAEQSWWRRALTAVNREYERRVRRASEVSEYGARHHAHPEHDDEGAAAIVNVPRGTRLVRPAPPPQPEPAAGDRDH